MTTVDQSLLEIKMILGGLSNELTSVNAKIDKAENSSISRFDAVRKEIDSVKTEIYAVKSEIYAVKSEIDAVKSEIDAVKSEIDAVKSEIDAVKSEVLEAEKWSKARSDGVRVQLIDMEKATTSKFDSVKSEMAEAEKRAIDRIDTVKVKIIEMQREKNSTSSSKVDFEGILPRLEQVMTAVFSGELDDMDKKTMIRYDAMREMLVSTRESIGVLEGNMASTNEEMSSLKRDLMSTEEMVVEELTAVRHSIESMRADAESTTRALRAVEGEMTATTNSMRNVETAFVYRTEKFDSSKSEYESLKTAIESFEGGVSIGISSLKAQVSQVEEKVTSVTESLSRESMSLKADISEAKDEITKEIVSVATSNNAAMEEQKASTSIVVQRLEGIILDNGNKLTKETSAIKEAIGQQTFNLEQLRSYSMEAKVVNKDISEEIKQSVLESLSVTREHLSAKSTIIQMQLDKNFHIVLKNECIDSLVGKTVIHGDDSSKLSIVRSRYERLYSKGPLVSILMKFLLFHPKVRVHFDFGSKHIGRMKTEFFDFDGDNLRGSNWNSFPDLEEERVYFGGDWSEYDFIAFLARPLCIMCLHLLYDNGGLPFKKGGDPRTEKKWDEMLQEGEGKKGRGKEGLGEFIYGLNWKTRKGKLIYLISYVPNIIAKYGSSNGINKVREWLPSILDLYQQQVVPDLTRDWESKMAAGFH